MRQHGVQGLEEWMLARLDHRQFDVLHATGVNVGLDTEHTRSRDTPSTRVPQYLTQLLQSSAPLATSAQADSHEHHQPQLNPVQMLSTAQLVARPQEGRDEDAATRGRPRERSLAETSRASSSSPEHASKAKQAGDVAGAKHRVRSGKSAKSKSGATTPNRPSSASNMILGVRGHASGQQRP